jgi:predicted  nucleic acid-binding Zn-ribbon protein
MYDIDLLIALGFMALLFLRHVAILKKPNKINYAPLMIAIGTIATLLHFMLHPDPSNIILLLRESFMPLLVSVILYFIMNILNQTKESQSARLHDEFTEVLVAEITQLKEFILELEDRMTEYSQEDRKIQKEIQEKFQKNQIEFTKKFSKIEEWNENVNSSFKHFSEVQMPQLDNVVHKHIDMLRIAEQDHYNKLKVLLEKAGESRYDIAEDVEALKSSLNSMKSLSDNIAKTIVEKTVTKMSLLSKDFESYLVSLNLHAESLKKSLYTDEDLLNNIRTQSEMIMEQMLLSAKQMEEFGKQNSNLYSFYSDMKNLMDDIEHIRSDYVKAQAQLTRLSMELEYTKDENYIEIKEKIENLTTVFSKKLDESLEKLYEHYHMTNENITENVKIMAKKAQLQKGYGNFDD